MGEWQEVKGVLYRNDPCFGCQGGSCDITQKVENGKSYEKVDYCQETCQILKDYNGEKPEPLFGQHIREAYRALKG